MLGYVSQIAAAIRGRQKPSKVPASLFWQAENFGLDSLSFDLLIDETNGVEYEVSEHVLENGEAVADHIRRHLRKVTVTGLFTNHGLNKNSADWTDENGKFKKGKDEIKLNGEPMEENRALEQYRKLQAIADERKKVRITTALEIYENMVIANVRTQRGPEDGEAIRFTMDLQEIKTIGTVRPQYDSGKWTPPRQDSAQTRAAAQPKNGGNVTGQDADAAEMAADYASVNKGQWAN